MEQLEKMKETLIRHVSAQIDNIYDADCKELGEAIDMIKDLDEAMYYCSIVKAMEEQTETGHMKYYTEPRYREKANMYYMPSTSNASYDDENTHNRGLRNNGYEISHKSMYNIEPYYSDYRDEREGRSPMRRKKYFETKEYNKGKEASMRELEAYAQELTQDIVEMVKDATPEEKQVLKQKINSLADKIG